MSQPSVSILIPMKNAESFIEECVDSIVNQTFKDWELIVVDDHSDDNSYNILLNYSHKDQRIQILKNEGKGIIQALQKAYGASSGRYITRMDADDIMKLDKLDLMFCALKEEGRGFVAVGLVEYFSAVGVGNGYLQYAEWLNSLTLSASNFSDIYKECSIPSPCWMIHRDDFDMCGGFDSEVYPEDYDLAFRFRKMGFKIAPVKKVIHRWRDYPTRTSRTDEHYTDNRFLELKVHHFLEQDYDADLPLVIWGAGHRGKKIARLLGEKDVTFEWFCDNPKKIGREIYGTYLQELSKLFLKEKVQVMVSISSFHKPEMIQTLILENGQHGYFRFS